MKRPIVAPIVILLFAAGLKAQPITAEPPSPWAPQIVIDVKNVWTSTGLVVLQDSIYDIVVYGQATATPYSYTWYGPDGNGGPVGSGYPLEGWSGYSVIGKIGASGTPFYVGAHRRIRILDPSDTLYLGYNDHIGLFSDNNGYFVAHINFVSSAPTVGIADEPSGIPSMYRIQQNYPNPFNPSTTIEYEVAHSGQISIDIYNTAGQFVRTLVNGFEPVGKHSVTWDGKDETGSLVSTGAYFYEIRAGDRVGTKKMLMIK